MFYTSFLEMAAQEKDLCDEIQLQINILEASKQAEAEGIDTDKHAKLLAESGQRLAGALPKLHRIRAMMGGRLMMYEDMAAKVLRDKMNQPGGDGK